MYISDGLSQLGQFKKGEIIPQRSIRFFVGGKPVENARVQLIMERARVRRVFTDPSRPFFKTIIGDKATDVEGRAVFKGIVVPSPQTELEEDLVRRLVFRVTPRIEGVNPFEEIAGAGELTVELPAPKSIIQLKPTDLPALPEEERPTPSAFPVVPVVIGGGALIAVGAILFFILR